MKLLNTVIVSCCSLAILMSCANDKKENKEISSEHLNIIITPDLSNRIKTGLYPKPVNDVALIESIFDNYYPTFYEYGHRISGQKDALNLAFTNANIITEYNYSGVYSIDISQKEDENISYLKTFDGTQTQFKKESAEFINALESVYDQVSERPAGADISGFFKNINSILKNNDKKEVQNYTVDTKYRNIVVLFTDGYVEAGLYGKSNCIGNKCYFLDGFIINKFRKDYKRNGKGIDLKTFFNNNEYGIVPVENDKLKNVEIFVCELYDRSLNKRTGSQTVIPNDLDIMKLFWSDWLKNSGFKKYKIIEKVNSVNEFQSSLNSFIYE